MSCAQLMYQPYSASPYVPQDSAFGRVGSPTDSAASAAAAAAAAAAATGKEQKYKVCASPGGEAPLTPPGGAEEDQRAQHNVKFLASNCVLVTNYCGDVASVVDEHFARALSQNPGFDVKLGSVTSKDSLPMTQRNLPASFWNSGYHSRATVTSVGHSGAGHELYTDPYHSSSLHGLHQSDPWHYALASQAYPGRELSGYGGATAGVAAARFNGYGPLLFPPPARLPAGQATKGDWAPRGYPDVSPELGAHSHPHPHPHPHPLDPGFGAGAVGYGNVVSGLESSLHAAASGKDSYWL
ncbi:transcription cofactor vestigial-like protein 2 [Pollicipes pollicipes]|uniref:transcription cofactor vestigial-like protein 2 n=1 Tax=Pollicipes pollicipes TaxID=41117 RepID=UPI001884CFEE|nr:transcription cofactor vestigial-like protein 2 [Pollicipes pollicipes]